MIVNIIVHPKSFPPEISLRGRPLIGSVFKMKIGRISTRRIMMRMKNTTTHIRSFTVIIYIPNKVMYLTLDKGPMWAGKSLALWKRYEQYRRQGDQRILVLKHEFDTRFSPDHIVARNGHRIPCKRISSLDHINIKEWDVIIIDEAQWFENLERWCRNNFHENVRVHIAGLSGDRDQKCFGDINSLSSMCSEEIVHYARCCICNDKAPFTIYVGHLSGRDVVGDDGYYPVCYKHISPKLKDELPDY